MPDAVQMAPFSPDAAPKPTSHTGRVVAVILLLLVVGRGGRLLRDQPQERALTPAAIRVRVMSPKPAAVYRWFSGRGTVTDHEARTLAFDSPGRWPSCCRRAPSFAGGEHPRPAARRRRRSRGCSSRHARASRVLSTDAREHARRRQPAGAAAGGDQARREAAAGRRDEREPREAGGARGRAGRGGRDAGQGRHVRARRTRRSCASRAACCTASSTLDARTTRRRARARVLPRRGRRPRSARVECPEPRGDQRHRRRHRLARRAGGAAVRRLHAGAGTAAATSCASSLPDNVGLVPGQPLRLARQRFDAVFPVPRGAVSGAGGTGRCGWRAAAGIAERRDVVVADARATTR